MQHLPVLLDLRVRLRVRIIAVVVPCVHAHKILRSSLPELFLLELPDSIREGQQVGVCVQLVEEISVVEVLPQCLDDAILERLIVQLARDLEHVLPAGIHAKKEHLVEAGSGLEITVVLLPLCGWRVDPAARMLPIVDLQDHDSLS